MNIKNAAIILAGGTGSRYGSDTPKQFTSINGRMVLDYTVEQFDHDADMTVLVVSKEYISPMSKRYKHKKNFYICEGGCSRQESVLKALEFLKDFNPELAAVHDGARMLVSRKMIKDGFKTAAEKGSAVPVVPVSDTLWRKDMTEILDRDDFVLSQTPQVFNYLNLCAAHKNAGSKIFSDCAGLYANTFKNVYIYEGDKKNIKLTAPEDRQLIKAILSINKS